MYIYIYMYIHIYLFICMVYEAGLQDLADVTPSPPTKSSGFRGFDSSKLLIIKGGNSHVRIIL